MKIHYHIRLLTPKDVDIVRSIRLEALKTDPEAFCGLYEEEILYSDEEFNKILRNTDIFGIFDDSEIIGFAGFDVSLLTKLKHTGYLSRLYIKPRHRRKGAGSQLLVHIIGYAKRRVLQLCLYCLSDNLPLIRFYEKHGFVTFGSHPREMRIGDRFYNTNIMFLKLD